MTPPTDRRAPATRCDWVDQLRGWAILVMIEVHCTNVWLDLKLRPDWLNFLNGLVAPSFLTAAGFSLVVSTFRKDGTLRPFWDSGKRYLFILACAYALHAPGLSLVDWTVLATDQKWRELFKIDVLQCIVFSLLILQGLARLIRRPRVFTLLALGLALYIPLVSPFLWAHGVADSLWLPIRGLFNGNPDRGVQALFPLFPWLAFVAFGAFLGGAYRFARQEEDGEGRARWTEVRFLAALAILGLILWWTGHATKEDFLWGGQWVQHRGVWMDQTRYGAFTWSELQALGNTTLPSVAERLGWICLAGAAMGAVERIRPRWKGENAFASASRESLLIYMFHLNLIFGVLLSQPVLDLMGWQWNSQGWAFTLLMTAGVLAVSLGFGLWWQSIRKDAIRMRSLQRLGLSALAVWFLVGNWWTFRHYLRSPELAREPYVFLNAARARKGLPPTPDGLTRDPEEYFAEAEARGIVLNDTAKAKIREQILSRK
ncbi:MAG TPA: heparan-alpha-glucosaminide N-acetyltransferase domain-containing protein [Holophagaceae bacterium]|nr:heparan-alpha-glucosaminide N-acetyltransferase domain-containing protein [Holophagaceae bacterium]